MPSPFPGMDPYLEDPDSWEDIHLALISAVRAQLNAVLPPGFRARAEKRVRIEGGYRPLRPDALVTTRASRDTEGGLAVLEHPVTAERTPPILLRTWQDEEPQRHVEVVTLRKPERVVALIEILSPTNKTPGRGWEEYGEKQRLLLESQAHLLEIDLLREGRPTVAAPQTEDLPQTPYRACLHRAGHAGAFEIWPISLQESLPEVRVPLLEGLPDVHLDLQIAFVRAYDEGGYLQEIDYSLEAVPPLTGDDALWAEALLRERGLRP